MPIRHSQAPFSGLCSPQFVGRAEPGHGNLYVDIFTFVRAPSGPGHASGSIAPCQAMRSQAYHETPGGRELLRLPGDQWSGITSAAVFALLRVGLLEVPGAPPWLPWRDFSPQPSAPRRPFYP
jgi:hypothetical protein